MSLRIPQRKEIYEALYPQTKRGTAGAMSRWGTDATAESAVASFHSFVEAQFHATWQGHIVTLINERDAVLSWEQIKRSAKF